MTAQLEAEIIALTPDSHSRHNKISTIASTTAPSSAMLTAYSLYLSVKFGFVLSFMFQSLGANISKRPKSGSCSRFKKGGHLSRFKELTVLEDAQVQGLCTEGASVHGAEAVQERSWGVQGGPLAWWWAGSAGHAAPWGSARAPEWRCHMLSSSGEKKFKG